MPVDGFWSISLYNAEGYYQKNEYDAYSLNNITAKKSAMVRSAIQFGGCDGKTTNCLPIVPAGITPCVSIAPEKKSSTALGSFRKRSRSDIFPRESNS